MIASTRRIAACALAAALCLFLCFGLSAVSAAKASPASRPVVVLDAGHGGIDPGVVGTDTGVRESELNLSVVKILEELFAEAGFCVVLTRTGAGGLYGLPVGSCKQRDMQARRRVIEESRPNIEFIEANAVISVHQNSFPADRSRRGGQVFYRQGDAAARTLAEGIQRQLNALGGGRYEPLAGDYYVLNCTRYTSVIVECGFLSNPQEEALRKFHFKLVDSDPAFRAAMAVKSAEELACIRRASEIAEEAYASLLGELKEGMTENEVAALLEYKMRLAGAQDRSFETIAAFGANTSVPHHAPCGDKLRRGTLVLLDFGCRWGGYCSDITRTFLFGKNDDADLSAAYMAVYDAHRAAADSIASGMTGKEADALARGSLASRGLDKFFTHSLGHGIGVNIHEFPTLGPSSKDVLEDNMVFSIEPGVYFEGKFGIRIEDSVTLSGGRVVSFMHSDKKLTVL